VARPDDWPEGIVGWLCAEQTDGAFIVHYAHTKPYRRKEGVLTALLASLEPTGKLGFSHLRPPYSDTLKRRGYGHVRL
jgi:hypothetical protein